MVRGIIIDTGDSIPASTDHAVSVSLPTWKANIGYEEGEEWVVGRMKTGYPRFFIHKSIQALKSAILKKHFSNNEDLDAIVLPTHAAAVRGRHFLLDQGPASIGLLTRIQIRIIDLNPNSLFDVAAQRDGLVESASPAVSALVFPSVYFGTAKAFWQHTGEGVSSRRAEFAHAAFDAGFLSATITKGGVCASRPNFVIERHPSPSPSPSPTTSSTATSPAAATSADWKSKGPRRYRGSDRPAPASPTPVSLTAPGSAGYVEERFGRNVTLSMADEARTTLRRRIAAAMNGNITPGGSATPATSIYRPAVSESDVFLYPCGMNAIFHTHQNLLEIDDTSKSIEFGFPYIDTLKLLQKFGPGCVFYGLGSDDDLDDLEARLRGKAGAEPEQFLALFCEFPSNPLLKAPNLGQIRRLADQFEFLVVVDETIGNFFNIDLLNHADVIVSSLTKIFSGDSNVMGGTAILNPRFGRHAELQAVWSASYIDTCWAEDVVFLERNSRDFLSRAERINVNAEAICSLLGEYPTVQNVFYPKVNPSRAHYDACRRPAGRYGGLLSASFYSRDFAMAFFDALETAKGPSLGTNFTLTSPYVILAHYNELDWAASFGVDPYLIRFSIGLEKTDELVAMFKTALEVAAEATGSATPSAADQAPVPTTVAVEAVGSSSGQ